MDPRTRTFPVVLVSLAAAIGCGPSTSKPHAPGGYVPPEVVAGPEGEQLHHGERVYAFACQKCHGENGEGLGSAPRIVPIHAAPTLGGRKDAFRTAADVVDFVRGHMPEDSQGLLDPNAYWDVTAYVLRRGGIALHGHALDADSAPAITIP